MAGAWCVVGDGDGERGCGCGCLRVKVREGLVGYSGDCGMGRLAMETAGWGVMGMNEIREGEEQRI